MSRVRYLCAPITLFYLFIHEWFVGLENIYVNQPFFSSLFFQTVGASYHKYNFSAISHVKVFGREILLNLRVKNYDCLFDGAMDVLLMP